jgi:hypothetical protein
VGLYESPEVAPVKKGPPSAAGKDVSGAQAPGARH